MIKEVTYLYEQKPSKTIPDEAYTVAQILERFMRGQGVDGQRVIHYGEDEDFDDYDPTLDPDFDIVDAYTRMQQFHANMQERERINKEQLEKKPAEHGDPENSLSQQTHDEEPDS